MWPRVRDERVLLASLAGLVALAWFSLWTWERSPYGALLDHHGHAHLGGGSVYLALAGWTLMLVAMMLPTSLPLVALFRSFVRTRPNPRRLTAFLVGGYLLIWILVGFLMHAGDLVFRASADQSDWIRLHAWAIGALIVGTAGLYQFTSLKHKCLEKCRSPLSFIMENWRGRRGEGDAFRLGIHHGLFCVGCCWSLMLLMFVVSVGNLGWMLALAVVMAVEKNIPWGRRLSAPLGALLLCGGAVLVATHVGNGSVLDALWPWA
jgi:predicted metal-binding membrane protein